MFSVSAHALIQSALQLRTQYPVLVPFLLLCLTTLGLQIFHWDLPISACFFDAQREIWPLLDRDPWNTIDEWLVIPGMTLGIVSIAAAIHAFLWNSWNDWTRAALFVTCVYLIAPGLLVNGILKPSFSRPRPREVVQLGGQDDFKPAWGFGERFEFNSSFPSGHASIGFFMIAPAFAFRHRRRWSFGIFCGGLIYGSIMSLSRIVQGGHYLSDILWSLGIVYFTCWGVATLMTARELFLKQKRHPQSHPVKIQFAHAEPCAASRVA